METSCPACGSGETMKLSELWDEIASGNEASLGRLEAAIAAQRPGDDPEGESRETLRTFLLRELAPPEKRADLPASGSCLQMSAGVVMILGGLGLVVVATLRLAAAHLDVAMILVIALGGLAVGAVGYVIGRYGAPKATYREYQERLLAWHLMYRCMHCGNQFAVDGGA